MDQNTSNVFNLQVDDNANENNDNNINNPLGHFQVMSVNYIIILETC